MRCFILMIFDSLDDLRESLFMMERIKEDLAISEVIEFDIHKRKDEKNNLQNQIELF